jgi:hypothetical protein
MRIGQLKRIARDAREFCGTMPIHRLRLAKTLFNRGVGASVADRCSLPLSNRRMMGTAWVAAAVGG